MLPRGKEKKECGRMENGKPQSGQAETGINPMINPTSRIVFFESALCRENAGKRVEEDTTDKGGDRLRWLFPCVNKQTGTTKTRSKSTSFTDTNGGLRPQATSGVSISVVSPRLHSASRLETDVTSSPDYDEGCEGEDLDGGRALTTPLSPLASQLPEQ